SVDCCALLLDLTSFPTRRSSDLQQEADRQSRLHRSSGGEDVAPAAAIPLPARAGPPSAPPCATGARHREFLPAAPGISPRALPTDRKSTRLNSSHVKISYAVFCL